MTIENRANSNETKVQEVPEPVIKRIRIADADIEVPVNPRSEMRSGKGEVVSENPRIGYKIGNTTDAIRNLGGSHMINARELRLSPRETDEDIVNAVAEGRIDAGIVNVIDPSNDLKKQGLILHHLGNESVVTRTIQAPDEEAVLQIGQEQNLF